MPNPADIKKTIYYMQRNGLRHTWYAVRERLAERKRLPYVYEPPSRETLKAQTEAVLADCGAGRYDGIGFSIVVPAYRTRPEFIEQLVNSLRSQSYPFWELIFADATEDDSVRCALEKVAETEMADAPQQGRDFGVVRYLRLQSNEGISENTNRALAYAGKEYIGLLDHDDILAPDALYEMAKTIRRAKEQGKELQLIFSDEDKCNEEATDFYEPNHKEKFNFDLILSNNYICHFMVMKTELMQRLGFRREYDGAQDYDLVLRALGELGIYEHPEQERLICHVPKVLYHWRCHGQSTALNPRSKEYAYEAGRRAVQDYLESGPIPARAVPLRHLGFYGIRYGRDIFGARKDLGAVGGAIFTRGKLCGGRMDENGKIFYEGLPKNFSGYLHRAVLSQDADAVDIRNMAMREELHGVFEEVVGVPYRTRPGESRFDADALPEDTDYRALSIALCRAIREKGYRILYRRKNE